MMGRAVQLFFIGLMAGVVFLAASVCAWGDVGGSNKDRVLLESVTALTLQDGKMTAGRRSSPVKQLNCVGGSAGCSYSNMPRVVQCHNRGFDGYDVQWECKGELDSKVQFGKLQVSCEGYEYPDDPYILRGSCGLEYELDLTQHGQNSHHDNYHHDNDHHGYPNYGNKSWSWGGLLALVVGGFILYQVLKGCFGGGRSRHGMATGPTTNSGSQTYSSQPPNTGGTGGGGWGGFWTGAATGGALGYLFGGRRGYGGYGGGYGPSWGRGYSGGYGGSGGSGWTTTRRSGGGFGGFGGGGSRSSSSSSRTSSGFGGTSRR